MSTEKRTGTIWLGTVLLGVLLLALVVGVAGGATLVLRRLDRPDPPPSAPTRPVPSLTGSPFLPT